MKKNIAIIFLIMLLSIAAEGQFIQATIRAGTAPNSADIYFKPNFNNNKTYFDNLSITVAVPTQSPSATATITTRNINGIDWNTNLAGIGGTEGGPSGPYAGYTFYTFLLGTATNMNPVILTAGVEILAATVTFTGSAGLVPISLVSLDNINGGASGQRYTYLQMSGSPQYDPGPYGPIGQVSPDPLAGGVLFYSVPGVNVVGQFEPRSPFVTTTTNISLPVKLKSFSGTQDNCVGVLDWQTAEEVNFIGFEVEQSLDGTNYTKAGTVQAVGGTASNSYRFNAGRLDGRMYYRLKMIDNDGKFTYSNVVLLTANCGSSGYGALLYPNPAGKGTDVNVNLYGFSGVVSGKLYDAQGRLVNTQSLKNGTNVLTTARLAAGMYHLALSDGAGNTVSRKIVVAQ